MQIILATKNQGKIKEIQYLAQEHHPNLFEFLPIPNHIGNIDEPYPTFVENALHKAREVSKHSASAVIAEDSGLIVPALKGMPGIYSARYGSINNNDKVINNFDDQLNNQKLLTELKNLTQNSSESISRAAYYFCACVYIKAYDDQHPLITQGIWHGEIIDKEIGNNGFGYDPLFWLKDLQKTSAQLTLAEKCKISHRAKALIKMFDELKTFDSNQYYSK